MIKSKIVTVAAIFAALALVAGLVGYVTYTRHQAAASANGQVTEVNKDNFETEVMKSQVPVFIEFYATWCAPCQQQAPLVEQAAKDYAGKVKFVKVDVDKSPEIAAAIGITSIPTMILVNPATGSGVAAVGFLDQEALKKFIEDGLARAAQPSKP